MSEEYRVIEVPNHAYYDYLLISPTGEEINGGLGLDKKTAMEIQAGMLNEAIAPLLETIQAQAREIEALKAWQKGAMEDFKTIADKAKRIYNGDVDMESAQALALGIYSLSNEENRLFGF